MNTRNIPAIPPFLILSPLEKIVVMRDFCDDAQLQKICATQKLPAEKCAALLLTTKGEMFKLRYDVSHYRSIEKAVGGEIDIVEIKQLKGPNLMVVNDIGYPLGLPLNRLATKLYGTGWNILGDVVFAESGFLGGEPDLVGSTEDEIQRLGDEFIQMTNGSVHWGKDGKKFFDE